MPECGIVVVCSIDSSLCAAALTFATVNWLEIMMGVQWSHRAHVHMQSAFCSARKMAFQSLSIQSTKKPTINKWPNKLNEKKQTTKNCVIFDQNKIKIIS